MSCIGLSWNWAPLAWSRSAVSSLQLALGLHSLATGPDDRHLVCLEVSAQSHHHLPLPFFSGRLMCGLFSWCCPMPGPLSCDGFEFGAALSSTLSVLSGGKYLGLMGFIWVPVGVAARSTGRQGLRGLPLFWTGTREFFSILEWVFIKQSTVAGC